MFIFVLVWLVCIIVSTLLILYGPLSQMGHTVKAKKFICVFSLLGPLSLMYVLPISIFLWFED